MRMFGLDLEQIAWRRNKLAELRDPLLFKQEYPLYAAEAFQVTGLNTFVRADTVIKSRKTKTARASEWCFAGFDPAGEGGDRAAFIMRAGNHAFGLEFMTKRRPMELVGFCKDRLENARPVIDRLFVDVGERGSAIVDRILELDGGKYAQRVVGVNFGGTDLQQPERHRNKRAEMWSFMRDWLESGVVSIPDSDELHADLMAPGYKYDSNTRLLLESKEDMRKRGVRSPDGGDALALTFAEPAPVADGKRLTPVNEARAVWEDITGRDIERANSDHYIDVSEIYA
jgi:hypothetical protein